MPSVSDASPAAAWDFGNAVPDEPGNGDRRPGRGGADESGNRSRFGYLQRDREVARAKCAQANRLPRAGRARQPVRLVHTRR